MWLRSISQGSISGLTMGFGLTYKLRALRTSGSAHSSSRAPHKAARQNACVPSPPLPRAINRTALNDIDRAEIAVDTQKPGFDNEASTLPRHSGFRGIRGSGSEVFTVSGRRVCRQSRDKSQSLRFRVLGSAVSTAL